MKKDKDKKAQKVRRPYNLEDPELASDEDIMKVFHSYARSLEELAEGGIDASRGRYLNPMQFSSILRLVTEEKSKSNLFKEMQIFKRFDIDNNASINEEEFVEGWKTLSRDEGHGDFLYTMKKLVGEDNILL